MHGLRVGCLNDNRYMQQTRVSHQHSKRLDANGAFSNMVMSIYTAAERLFGVVCMNHLQPIQPDESVEGCKGGFIGFSVTQIIAGSEDMACVQTDAQSEMFAH